MNHVRRFEKQHYINVGTEDEPKWSLVGAGFTVFEESKRPIVREKRYIHEENFRSEVVGYAPEIRYEMEVMRIGEAVSLIRDLTDREPTGEEALIEVLTVEKYRGTGVENEYSASKRSYVLIPDKCSPPEDELKFTGTLAGAGESVAGHFNTVSLKFTASESAIIREI